MTRRKQPFEHLRNGEAEAAALADYQQAAAWAERQQAEAAAPAAPPAEWVGSAPIPLGSCPIVPPFPVLLLPAWLRDWVAETAEATQTPPDLAAMLTLTIAGAALARKYQVVVRASWPFEPVNIFSVTALFVGERKSGVFRAAIKPVEELERQLVEAARPRIAEANAKRRILEASLKAAENRAAKADKEAEKYKLTEEAKKLARDLDEHVVPVAPQLYVDEETPESLSRKLAQQGGRLLQASAEGTCFEIAKGRYSETANFDVYLKGHAGDPLRVGRVTREGESIERPALSVALAVQPDVISGLAAEATMRGRGFLARFLYSLPASLVGRRRIAPLAVSGDSEAEYQTAMQFLWKLEGSPKPHELQFSNRADAVLQELERWLEPRLAPGEELSLLAGWANKLAGACARLAAILHAAAAAGKGDPPPTMIEHKTVEAAVKLGRDYFLPHAQAAFALMGADERQGHAQAVLRSLPELASVTSVTSVTAPPCVSRRDIHRKHHRRFVRAEELDPVLDLLVRHGWLQPTGEGRVGRGGQPSLTYWIHPAGVKDTHAGTRTPGDTGDTGDTDGTDGGEE